MYINVCKNEDIKNLITVEMCHYSPWKASTAWISTDSKCEVPGPLIKETFSEYILEIRSAYRQYPGHPVSGFQNKAQTWPQFRGSAPLRHLSSETQTNSKERWTGEWLNTYKSIQNSYYTAI